MRAVIGFEADTIKEGIVSVSRVEPNLKRLSVLWMPKQPQNEKGSLSSKIPTLRAGTTLVLPVQNEGSDLTIRLRVHALFSTLRSDVSSRHVP